MKFMEFAVMEESKQPSLVNQGKSASGFTESD